MPWAGSASSRPAPPSPAGRAGDQAVIRRGFWLVTGAVLGVTGYRRASRLGRVLTGQARDGGVLPAGPRPPGAIGVRWRSPLALTMRTPARAAPVPRPADRIASAAGFVRDVQEGMAEYWDLHRGDEGRNLGSQGTQATSGGASSSRASGGRASAGWAFSGGREQVGREQVGREQDRRDQDPREPGSSELPPPPRRYP